jgi:hypothetical protein
MPFENGQCTPHSAPNRRRGVFTVGLLATALIALLLAVTDAFAAQSPVDLGTAASFSVLGGSAVTNTGASTLGGDLGVSPGTAITGFPPGIVGGTIHSADAVAAQAQSDLTTAYDDAAGRNPPTSVPADIGGLRLTAGVYRSASAIGLTGTVTLDAQGNPDAVFIFQAGSTLITASGSNVALVNGAEACNVFWQVGSSATLGTASVFTGNILALTSISANQGVTVHGRLLARNGAVTLIDDAISSPACAAAGGNGTTGGSGSGPSGGGTTGSGGGTTGSGGGTTGSGGGTTGSGGGNTGSGGGNTGSGGGTTGSGGGTTGSGAGNTGSAGGTHADVGIANLKTVPSSIAKHGIEVCERKTFRALVTGHHIRQVSFSLDGRVIATRTRAAFAATVPTGGGIRTVIAHVKFTGNRRERTVRMKIRACAAAVRPARIPIGIVGFTG